MAHRVNAGYTVLVPLQPARVAEADALLEHYQKFPKEFPFADSPSTHFATVTVIPAQRWNDEPLPALLAIMTSFAGPPATHVEELATVLGAPLRALLALCEGVPSIATHDELVAFLVERRRGDTFYSGMQNLSREDVVQHRQLRDAIEVFLDEHEQHGTALEVRERIQNFVRSRDDLAWAQQPFRPPLAAYVAMYWPLAAIGLVVVPFVLVLAGFTLRDLVLHATLSSTALWLWSVPALVAAIVGGSLVAIRLAEEQQTYVSGRQPDPWVRELSGTQNRAVINEFVIAGPIKEEGWIRPPFLRAAMWVVARVAVLIDIPTVATARWIPSDGGRRLIFISNYTNAAEPYVRDFIDVHNGAERINLTFGFGRGYPKTKWVIDDGARTDPNGFIYVVTEQQRKTGFWFGPYPDMSIDNIKLDRQIREGLFAKLDEKGAQAWLHLL